MNKSNYQKQIFNEIKSVKDDIQGLSAYVQNDFNKLLKNGTITKKKIRKNILDMIKDFDNTIESLDSLKHETRDLMESFLSKSKNV